MIKTRRLKLERTFFPFSRASVDLLKYRSLRWAMFSKVLGLPVRPAFCLKQNRLFTTSLAALKPKIFTDSVLSSEKLFDNGISPDPDCTVKVSQVSYEALPEHVLSPFKRFGEIEYMHVPYDENTGSMKGMAFVKFRDAKPAKRAAVQLNGFVLNNLPIRTALSSESAQAQVQQPYEIVIVKNLDYSTTDEEVMEVFRPYQAIRLGLRRAPVGDKPCLGYGFVRFGTISSATKAVNSLKNLKIRNRNIKVKFAKPMEHNYTYIV